MATRCTPASSTRTGTATRSSAYMNIRMPNTVWRCAMPLQEKLSGDSIRVKIPDAGCRRISIRIIPDTNPGQPRLWMVRWTPYPADMRPMGKSFTNRTKCRRPPILRSGGMGISSGSCLTTNGTAPRRKEFRSFTSGITRISS
ncbi:hypothetical protein D3C75_832950 [compost metagenome]